MKKMISYLAHKHPDWAHDQVVAVGASECGVSKKNDYALDIGTRVALRLNEYKNKYPHLSIKDNLAKAYYNITKYVDFPSLGDALYETVKVYEDLYVEDSFDELLQWVKNNVKTDDPESVAWAIINSRKKKGKEKKDQKKTSEQKEGTWKKEWKKIATSFDDLKNKLNEIQKGNERVSPVEFQNLTEVYKESTGKEYEYKVSNQVSIQKFDEAQFNKLKTALGKDYSYTDDEFNNIMPKGWNHLKKDYVAEITGFSDKYDGLNRTFISELSNFSSSKKNASIEVPDMGEMFEGDLIEIKTGSHKNMSKNIYRKDKDGWRLIAQRKGTGDWYGGGNKEEWQVYNIQERDIHLDQRSERELFDIASMHPNQTIAIKAIKKIKDEKILEELAVSHEEFKIRNTAWNRIKELYPDSETRRKVANFYSKTYYKRDFSDSLKKELYGLVDQYNWNEWNILNALEKRSNDFTEDAVNNPNITPSLPPRDPNSVGRPRSRGLKPKTEGAMISGAKRTTVGQSLKKSGIPLEASGQPTVTIPFRIQNTETGAIIEGQTIANNKGMAQMQPVSSSNVKAVGQQGNELVIAFHENEEKKFYRFQFQDPDTANEARMSLINSGSPGRWVWHNMRGHNAGEQVTPSKIGPSLEKGKPTIGGTSASLVSYTISQTAPSRVPGYKNATEVLKRETSNPLENFQDRERNNVETSLQNIRQMRDKGATGLFKNLQQRGITTKKDMTTDSASMSGFLTRSGEFDYTVEGGGIKTKIPENLKEIVEATDHVPVYGRRSRGSHQEADNTLIGFAHDLKFIPKGVVHKDYAFIHGGVEFFYDIEDMSDLDKPDNLSVSFGFDDAGYGGVQKITKLHHLAVSLNNVEKDRCSTMNGPSCTIGKNDPLKQLAIADMQGVMKIKMTINDQNRDEEYSTDVYEDLKADLQTKLGDGTLLEVKGEIYYKTEDGLYSIDFDAPSQQTGDNLPQTEVETPHQRTDSTKESCPLLKNKKKQKSETDMKIGIKKETDMDNKNDTEEEEMKAEGDDEKKKTKDTVTDAEDMKKEPEVSKVPEIKIPTAEDFKAMIADLVQKGIEEATRPFKEREAQIEADKKSQMMDLLQKEPYGFDNEFLETMDFKALGNLKAGVEKTKIYKDFLEAQKPIEQKVEIDKAIFNESTNDFTRMGDDPWRSFKSRGA